MSLGFKSDQLRSNTRTPWALRPGHPSRAFQPRTVSLDWWTGRGEHPRTGTLWQLASKSHTTSFQLTKWIEVAWCVALGVFRGVARFASVGPEVGSSKLRSLFCSLHLYQGHKNLYYISDQAFPKPVSRRFQKYRKQPKCGTS